MSKFQISMSIVFVFSFVSLSVRAELPSLMSDRTGVASLSRDSFSSALGVFESLRQGKVALNFAPLDYRFSSQGLRLGRAAANTLIGYNGERRLEFNWRANGGNLKLAVVAGGDVDGYRLELVSEF